VTLFLFYFLAYPWALVTENKILSTTFFLGVRAKITLQNWRSDLVQIWLIRESKTTGIASYFAFFASEVSAKVGVTLRFKNV
jgi:hypothetical protein